MRQGFVPVCLRLDIVRCPNRHQLERFARLLVEETKELLANALTAAN